ncbi:MAG TPA: TonB-dependent receptor [Acidobacteriota bacterium]|nr:TonB-dependent receptor [Acidobacteriota bacterium]
MARFIVLFLILVSYHIELVAVGLLTFSGRVFDESRHPISGVTITISGSANLKTVTDSNGKFSVPVPPGEMKLLLTVEGFFPLESKLTLVSSRTATFTMRSTNPPESVIVSASRVDTSILDSPSTVSVLPSERIENSPAQNYADLLRALPGVNANQISARVFRITTRQVASAGRIPTELVMVDGRMINMDLNGAASWDTIPVDTSQIERIEVVHGPASAIWGPNAQTGVVNIITKTPAELAGTSLSFSAGVFDRASDQDNGQLYSTNFTHGQILNDRFSLKVSGGIFDQDPLARPTGNIPVDPERGTGGAAYPVFENLETTQPKFDIRLDQQLQDSSRFSYSGGISWTEGTGHTSAGPAIIKPGSFLGYGKVSYEKENLYARFISNQVNLNTSFDFVRDSNGQLVNVVYDSRDYDLEAGNSTIIGNHHFLTYGGNVRIADFDLSLAPTEHIRSQFGAFLQDEFAVDRFRLVVGGRIDKFNVTDTIFSPRLAAMFEPSSKHSFRFSFSRAFRPPTLLESYQDLSVTTSVLDLGQFDPAFAGRIFPIIAKFLGNPELLEETTTAYELGYTGTIGENTMLGGAIYLNKNDHNIRNATISFYTSEHVPDNWPLSPEIFADLASRGVVFPSDLMFLNSGPIQYEGIELSLEHRMSSNLSFFANYSYQSDPKSLDAPNPFPKDQLYEPPNHRFNIGSDFMFDNYFANANVQYVSSAFWTDVLDRRFWGPTDAFTMVNAGIGRKWNDGKIVTSLNATNLLNRDIQQHIFGDIIKRTISVECRLVF